MMSFSCGSAVPSSAKSLEDNWMRMASHAALKKQSPVGSSSFLPVSPKYHQMLNATRPKRIATPNPMPVHAIIPPAMPRPPAAIEPPPSAARPDVITAAPPVPAAAHAVTRPMHTPHPTAAPTAEAPVTDNLTLACSSRTSDHTTAVPNAPPRSPRLPTPHMVLPAPNDVKPLVMAAAPPVSAAAPARTNVGAKAKPPPATPIVPADRDHPNQEGCCWLTSAMPEKDRLNKSLERGKSLECVPAWSTSLCWAMSFWRKAVETQTNY
mmetsp:Transcript_42176/g.83412  ORF Transcript_42176/g.83412 Transcript_42176/m.83412 type:complete len:266 (-) Transcript_42176:53-850(-)